uniref:DUF2997 domain-containing protein n=1 Tax=Odontella aurita TaxID=265563 RepID=A0A7S4K9M6_9STRA|mmetsp:Transcript_7605/g.22320  ORF Transcript_7605/g.22320 Transcript_7605/m.22320 type:complete len:127 (+) Transcript_7605:214-594(+)|eukprot:CAMPEP_0113534830 /NCGR_PEP_ID=MMETSP0015_2-20120614/5368_1 /TAXON_ID=2838 /ORGANISM="Odontella" /LENGTH=126 /DNA_ID=CAMNT_0000434017 /DNA_START=131 /DNA_END=511 /DNA_ORIENTATION=+ /assembly_acc=CAM_ASM_000160
MPCRKLTAAFLAATALSSGACAFVAPGAAPSFVRPQTSRSMSDNSGNIEEIEFRIYPDGRIEETVRGVRGNSCHEVTEAVNDMLGKVVESAPTEEMYENEVFVANTVEDKVDGGESSSGWEGSSSW